MNNNITHVDNCDTFIKDNNLEEELPNQLHPLLPKSPFKMLITGTSGAGKTNLVICMILKMIVYDKIYIFSRHLLQDKYKFLKQHLENIESAMEKSIGHKINVLQKWNHTLDELPSVEDLDKEYRHLILIDDFACCSKTQMTKISDLFIRGRHKNISTIFLTQLYFQTPRPIRLNTNYLAIFESYNRREITSLTTELGADLIKGKFQKIYKAVLSKPYNFLYIDNTTNKHHLRYRSSINGLYRGNEEDLEVSIDDFITED